MRGSGTLNQPRTAIKCGCGRCAHGSDEWLTGPNCADSLTPKSCLARSFDAPVEGKSMPKTVAASVLALSLFVATSGCLHEVTLNAKGGGTMTVSYHVRDKADLDSAKKEMGSSSVKVTSAELVGTGDASLGVFKLDFQDITKLSSAPFFKELTVTRADGSKPG